MKKLLLTLSFLAFTVNAHATVHYFHNGGTGAMPCSQSDPCDNFKDTTYDNAGAITPGDEFLFKAGDEWTGLEAQLAVQSNGTANNRITFGRYGTGANPKFTGGASTTTTWTSAGGGIYYTSMTAMDGGNQPLWDVDADRGLFRTFANNNALSAGSWCFSSSSTAGSSCANFTTGSFLFIRRWDGSDPNSHPFRIDTNVHNSGNGDRGLVRTTTNSSYGDYVDFVDLDIEAPGGIGFSTSGYNTRTANVSVDGAPRDGMLGYCSTGSNESGAYWEDYYSTVRYSASFGVGYGQGITTYCNNTSLIGTTADSNGMAGIDFLDFGTSSDVTQGLSMRNTSTNNGLCPEYNSFDTNFYCDGCSETMVYGLRSYKAGVGASLGASNARGGGILFGSEHPTTDPAENVDLLNSHAYGIHYAAFGLNNTITNSNIKSVRVWWNTFSVYNAGSFEAATTYQDLDTTAHHYENFYNIWLGDNSAVPMPLGTSLDLFYFDYNNYYRRGGSTTFFTTSSNRTLAQWQADSGEDANSVYGDPLFVNDSDTAADLHLQAGSPARDLIGVPQTFTYQSWVPTTVKNDIGIYGVKGATLAAGTYDDISVDADAGFHYDYASLINETVTPASTVAGANTTYSISFTMPQYVTALKYNWKIKVVFPAGTTLDSGGSTAVTNISGFNGGATASVSGQTVTITRDGDGYSTFPGTISFDLTNIGNPTAGTSGTYEIYTTDENDNQIATADSDIAGNTFTAGIAQQINVSGTINFSGVIRLS